MRTFSHAFTPPKQSIQAEIKTQPSYVKIEASVEILLKDSFFLCIKIVSSWPLLWVWPTLIPQGCTFLCLPHKTLSCNRAVKKNCLFMFPKMAWGIVWRKSLVWRKFLGGVSVGVHHEQTFLKKKRGGKNPKGTHWFFTGFHVHCIPCASSVNLRVHCRQE